MAKFRSESKVTKPTGRLQKLLAAPYRNGVGMAADYLHRRGCIRSAVLLLKIATGLTPRKVELMKRLTDILLANGEFTAAIAATERAVHRTPGHFPMVAHLASLHEYLGDIAKAEKLYSLVPDESAEKTRFNVRRLWEQKKYEDIIPLLNSTGQFENQLLNTYYAMGDLASAHRYYRTRPRSQFLAHAFKQPDPLDLRIASIGNRSRSAFVMVDSGIGDEIRMTSVYKDIQSLFRSVTMTCDPRMLTLLQRSFPGIEFIPVHRYRKLDRNIDMTDRLKVRPAGLQLCLNDDAVLAARSADVVFSLIDSLAELRTSRDAFHGPPALIPSRRGSEFKPKTTGITRPQIGIAWRSMLQSPKRDVNYFHPTDFAALSDLDADFWIMQPFPTDEELAALEKYISFQVPQVDLKDDIEGQADLASQMDIVMSPLTTTAELAASVGTQTLFLAPTRETTWRKNCDGRDVWHQSGWLIQGDPVEDRASLMQRAVNLADAILETPSGIDQSVL